MNNINFHDARVHKVAYDKETGALVIGLQLVDERELELVFNSVVAWDFSPFSFQNYLLDFKSYPWGMLPQVLINEYEIPARYLKALEESKASFFEVNPAAGMGGYVIADSVQAIFLT